MAGKLQEEGEPGAGGWDSEGGVRSGVASGGSGPRYRKPPSELKGASSMVIPVHQARKLRQQPPVPVHQARKLRQHPPLLRPYSSGTQAQTPSAQTPSAD